MPVLEFHCHTSASKDSLTEPAELIRAARRKGLDRVVITDHNSVAGARAAQALDPELVIVGEEIMTTKGEFLASFVTEEVPAGLTPMEAIRRLKDQGAFISVSHPFDEWRKGAWKEADLLEIVPYVDAIEVFNSRCLEKRFNDGAKAFAEKHNLPGTVGSDAHGIIELGKAVMVLDPFSGPDGMRNVIREAKHKTKLSPWWVHFISRYASMRKKMLRP